MCNALKYSVVHFVEKQIFFGISFLKHSQSLPPSLFLLLSVFNRFETSSWPLPCLNYFTVAIPKNSRALQKKIGEKKYLHIYLLCI